VQYASLQVLAAALKQQYATATAAAVISSNLNAHAKKVVALSGLYP
jgi:hypothetical protein